MPGREILQQDEPGVRSGRGDLNMLWTIITLVVTMFFIGLAALFMFLWALKSGQFDDIERPKHRMLDDD